MTKLTQFSKSEVKTGNGRPMDVAGIKLPRNNLFSPCLDWAFYNRDERRCQFIGLMTLPEVGSAECKLHRMGILVHFVA